MQSPGVLLPRTAQGNMCLMMCGTHLTRPLARRALPGFSRMINVVPFAMAKQKKPTKKSDESPYSGTVKLPVTNFNLRANSVVREPEIQRFWTTNSIYETLVESGTGDIYTLHDGPPYANGDLHIGHALNKILKDFINRYQILRGCRARFIPGWDTHGLPIELKVLQGMKEEERRGLTTISLRQKAKEYALKTLEEQREQFKRYGVWADWSTPYVTLAPEYEAAQLEVFGRMFLNGHIYRGRKPVHWSPSSRTALAEAELEYPEGHKSTSIYVAMPLVELGEKVTGELREAMDAGGKVGFAIWTTTPWTIPANLAVAVNGQLEYVLVEIEKQPDLPEQNASVVVDQLVVAKEMMEQLEAKFGVQLRLLQSFPGSVLEGCQYRHPLFDRVSPVLIGGDYITTESGTGLVHTAPGHGQEDYQVGQRHGLPLLSPVDDAGCFTDEAGPFVGLQVQGEGNKAVVKALEEAGVLLKVEMYEHKYPYDWRTKKPTIFRATSQWFASVEGFRQEALAAIKEVQWIPSSGENRITAMTEGRGDWCISRQRKWGVPIPVFYDITTGEPLLTSETLSHVQSLVAQHGSDVWWTMDVEELLPESLRPLAPTLRKGEDTMDVWFDSGSSWAGVVERRQGLNYPADLYLEGSDQHRGWFQSSLLTSVAVNGVAPYKQVLTHGFVLDEKGLKMSKSLGNVVDPRVVIEGGKDQKKEPAYGADVLRLWVASVDYTSDVMIGAGILKQVADVYRKIRGTVRFLLGSLSDFNPATDEVPYHQLPSMDQYLLSKYDKLMREVEAAYEAYQFTRIYQSIQRFCVVDLSNFYLDVAKDRLYIRATDDPARRSCQTVLCHVLEGLLFAIAPLVPHMAEDAWLNAPAPLKEEDAGHTSPSTSQPSAELDKLESQQSSKHAPTAHSTSSPSSPLSSVFQAGWPSVNKDFGALPQDVTSLWEAVLAIRDGVNQTLEKARSDKMIGAPLEAQVILSISDAQLADRIAALNRTDNNVDELRYVFITSQVSLVDDSSSITSSIKYHDTLTLENGSEVVIGVERAQGKKCARCWNYSTSLGLDPQHEELCERCTPVVKEMGFALPAKETVGV